MENAKKREALLKKLNTIYKKGYIPSRESSEYNQLYTKTINCFAHACFNLSNDDLQKLNPYKSELHDFFRNFGSCGVYNYFKVATEKMRQVGLSVQKSSLSESIQKNQWKIAYYIMNDEFSGTDIHFMIQGQDGKWTSKVGSTSKIEVYDKLPDYYHNDYSLIGIYKITNPYIKLDDQKEIEM